MFLLYLSPDEAQLLADTCIVPQVRERVKKLLEHELLPCDRMPKMVILHDDGSGMVAVATEYYTTADADRAFEREWSRLMKEEPSPESFILTGTTPKKKPRASRPPD